MSGNQSGGGLFWLVGRPEIRIGRKKERERERERERHKERKRKGGEQVAVHEHSFIAQDKRTSKVSASDWRRQASNLRVGQMQARI